MNTKNIERPLHISRKGREKNESGSHDATDEGGAGAPLLFEIHLCGVVKERWRQIMVLNSIGRLVKLALNITVLFSGCRDVGRDGRKAKEDRRATKPV